MTTRRESHRTERVAARVLEELATMLHRDYGDPRLEGVVLSSVAVTGDLSLATVRFVVMGDGANHARAKDAQKVLGRLTSTLRSKLGAVLGMRRTPDLRFVIDEEREAVARLDALLDEVGKEIRERRKNDGGT